MTGKLSEKIWQCDSIKVVVVETGVKFKINVKRGLGVQGFKYPGSKGKYFIMDKSTVWNWSQGLKESK